tara:strand:- start:4430 stop:4738 length:309 start_codon:yes stop_codon:yes gene_type:complete
MLTPMQRGALFWGVCIPLRSYLSSKGDDATLRAFAAVIGGRWLLGYENGDEGVFGGPSWWKEERPLHGALWAAYAATGNSQFLKIDTAVGAANWIFSNTSLI